MKYYIVCTHVRFREPHYITAERTVSTCPLNGLMLFADAHEAIGFWNNEFMHVMPDWNMTVLQHA